MLRPTLNHPFQSVTKKKCLQKVLSTISGKTEENTCVYVYVLFHKKFLGCIESQEREAGELKG
jgi:hypothetical protein